MCLLLPWITSSSIAGKSCTSFSSTSFSDLRYAPSEKKTINFLCKLYNYNSSISLLSASTSLTRFKGTGRKVLIIIVKLLSREHCGGSDFLHFKHFGIHLQGCIFKNTTKTVVLKSTFYSFLLYPFMYFTPFMHFTPFQPEIYDNQE